MSTACFGRFARFKRPAQTLCSHTVPEGWPSVWVTTSEPLKEHIPKHQPLERTSAYKNLGEHSQQDFLFPLPSSL